MQTKTKEYAVEITINASTTSTIVATNEDEAKEKAIAEFEENLIVWDCDFYEVTAEIEEQEEIKERHTQSTPVRYRYQIQIEVEAQGVVYVEAADEYDAEEAALEQEEEYYSLYSSDIYVEVSAEANSHS